MNPAMKTSRLTPLRVIDLRTALMQRTYDALHGLVVALRRYHGDDRASIADAMLVVAKSILANPHRVVWPFDSRYGQSGTEEARDLCNAIGSLFVVRNEWESSCRGFSDTDAERFFELAHDAAETIRMFAPDDSDRISRAEIIVGTWIDTGHTEVFLGLPGAYMLWQIGEGHGGVSVLEFPLDPNRSHVEKLVNLIRKRRGRCNLTAAEARANNDEVRRIRAENTSTEAPR